jgi:hypothetical protein
MELFFAVPMVYSFTSTGRLARSGPWSGALRGPWGVPDPFRLLRWRQEPLDGGVNGQVVRRPDPPRRRPPP